MDIRLPDGTTVLVAPGTRLNLKRNAAGLRLACGLSEGEVEVSRGDRLVTTPKELAQKPLDPSEIHLYESKEHHENWLECIRTRRRPICDAEVGHR